MGFAPLLYMGLRPGLVAHFRVGYATTALGAARGYSIILFLDVGFLADYSVGVGGGIRPDAMKTANCRRGVLQLWRIWHHLCKGCVSPGCSKAFAWS